MAGAVSASSAAAGPVSMEASAPTTCSDMSSPGSRVATVKSPSCGLSWSCARRLLMEMPLISAGLAQAQQLVRIDGEMRPGERPETDVSDAGRRGAVVLRNGVRVGAGQRARAQRCVL